MRRLATLALSAALVSLPAAVLLTPAAASADTSDFTITSFDSHLSLGRGGDGHAVVTVAETIVAEFPQTDQNRGIVRAIPDDYDGVDLQTEVLSVTDGAGADVPYEEEWNDGFLELALGTDEFVHGEQVYVITYQQTDAIRTFADTGTQEFYRDVNGTGWEQPFGSVTATVRVLSSLPEDLTAAPSCYVGAEGSGDTCDISRADEAGYTTFTAEAADLAPGENLTVVVPFEPGTFVEPERRPDMRSALAPWAIPVSIALLVLDALAVGAALAWRRRNRDAAGDTVIVQFAPPPGVDVMESAQLLRRASRAVPAQLVELAVEGDIRLRHVEGRAAGEYDAELRAMEPEDNRRRRTLVTLFGAKAEPGTLRAISSSETQLGKNLQAIAAGALTSSVARGLLTPTTGRGLAHAATATAVASTILAFLYTIVAAGEAPVLPIAAIVGGILASFACGILGAKRHRITDAGARVVDYLRGLREYLTVAEADRIRMLQSPGGAERVDATDGAAIVRLYERLLPYAVLWGVEREWAQVLETRIAEEGVTPGWYPDSTFSAVAFSSAVSSLSTHTTGVSWSGSGGGSFSGGSFGGGFSGGGSGGGGGGGR